MRNIIHMRISLAKWMQKTPSISILIPLHMPLPGSGGAVFKRVYLSGWLPLRPSRRAGSWHWAPSSATAAGHRHRRGRQAPWSTGPRPSSSARPARERPGASMEVSQSLLRLLSPFWNHQDAEILLKEQLDSLLYKNTGVTCHYSTRPCSCPSHV